ncbi:MAG: hypothetical protein AAB459_01555 [Patescibacteria group bacterium]
MIKEGELLDGEIFDRIFGPESEGLHYLPVNNIIIAGQYRSKYDEQDQLELAGSIDKDNLQNPVLVCEMTSDEASDYINYTNRVWGANVELKDFTPNDKSNYYILVAGHKRTLAVKTITEDKGYQSPAIAAFVTSNKAILDVLRLQGVENIHRAPIPQDKANLIHQMYLYGMENGIYNSQAEFIDDSPFSAHETRSALRYVVLPDEIKSYVDEGLLAYSTAVSLFPLYEAFYERLRFKDTYASEITQRLDAEFIDEVRYYLAVFPKMTENAVSTLIKNRILELTSGQMELYMSNDEVDSSIRRATPAVSLIRRSAENISRIIDVIDKYGGFKGWSADAKIVERDVTCDSLAITINALRRLKIEASLDTEFPGLGELIVESESLLVNLTQA